ncbi:NADH dehydrogenase [ubiquinone] 1 alpha subcomplex subunit 12 [Hyalella azteca]|uniref:NADH dehydrogenase [ubiquinone] 1 alpha subcomplex subunit 12 n=1 Tax=Hyalella azteca TaxID=294128 RepID=A0A8B7N8H7_HYAAZ|nr:NADH dehydrogenase [ubiquinone] 1 alpha subcomplex subunit 12 [Hyalella azteca]
MAFFGLDRVSRFFNLIKENGGFRQSLYKLYRQNDLKSGTLVGTDKLGNKYYENNEYFLGRNRWVIYSPSLGTDFDGSAVSPAWFGWLHYKTDIPPTQKEHVQYSYIDTTPSPNPTGTNKAYIPYTTGKPKIQAWVPPTRS